MGTALPQQRSSPRRHRLLGGTRPVFTERGGGAAPLAGLGAPPPVRRPQLQPPRGAGGSSARPSPGLLPLAPPAVPACAALATAAGAGVPAVPRGARSIPHPAGRRRQEDAGGAGPGGGTLGPGRGISTGKSGETEGSSLALGQPKVSRVNDLFTLQSWGLTRGDPAPWLIGVFLPLLSPFGSTVPITSSG